VQIERHQVNLNGRDAADIHGYAVMFNAQCSMFNAQYSMFNFQFSMFEQGESNAKFA